MSMHQGLDLSRFKKISSDKKTSTLRHTNGHEMKVAHSGLSPKMREHIEGMPVHLAGGGDPVAMDPESPEEVPDDTPSADVPPKPDNVPLAGSVDVNGAAPEPPEQPTSDDLDNEDKLYADDMKRGHIKPETYQSLFAKKDTLGKIGTLFGLVVGGAGAGLTHQPNAVLGMMQKELENDLEAQKTSNANAQNWLRLSQAHRLQKAQVRQMGTQNELTRAQTGKVPSEIALNKSHKANLDRDSELKDTTATLNRMQIAAYQHLTHKTDKLPPGPTKDTATNLLTGTIGPGIESDISKRNAQTVAQIGLRAAARGDTQKQPPKENPSGVDMDKMTNLIQQGQMAEKLGMPGGMRGGDVSAANAEAQKVADTRAAAKMYEDSFNRLDAMAAAGKLNPQMRQAEIATLAAKISHETVGRFNQDEQSTLAQSMFPDALDWGKARDEKFRKAMEHFKGEEAATPTLDRFGLKTPFPEYARAKSKKKTASKDAPGEHYKVSGGIKYKKGPNGEKIRVD